VLGKLDCVPESAGLVGVEPHPDRRLPERRRTRLLHLATRVRPGYLVAGGMATCAVGFALFTQLDANDGLALLVAASTIISIGIAPASTLGTNLIVGSAPAGSAGAASGVAQTGNELGGALGIAMLAAAGITARFLRHVPPAGAGEQPPVEAEAAEARPARAPASAPTPEPA
jgi:DHA2 family multidrug resistance protein-like MFS transporter